MPENQTTKATPEENLQKLLTHYGVPYTGNAAVDIPALSKATPQFALEFARYQDVELTLDALAHIRQTEATLNGWFVAHGTLSFEKGAGIVRKPGCRFLGVDGRVHDLRETDLPDAKPMDRVAISPCTISHNVLSGETRVSISRAAVLAPSNHKDTLPNTEGKWILAKCFEMAKDGAIRGDTGDFPVLVSGRIGTADSDVVYWPSGQYGESLKVRVYCADQQPFSLKLNHLINDVKTRYNLPQDASRQDMQAALAGEPILAYGKVGATTPYDTEKFGEDWEAFLSFADSNGLLSRNTSKGVEYTTLNFKKAPEGTTFVTVAGKRVMQAKHSPNKGWEIGVHYADNGGMPWLSAKRTDFRYKSGEKKGEDGTSNPDAFIVFPNRMANVKPTSRSFSGIATSLGSFSPGNGSSVPTGAKTAAPATPTRTATTRFG